jgi:hypothetical protein
VHCGWNAGNVEDLGSHIGLNMIAVVCNLLNRPHMMLYILVSLALSGCLGAADVLPLVQDHVLFATTAAMLWALGKFVTALVPPPGNSWFWKLFRRTLPWHPVFAGAWLGLAFPSLVPISVGAGRVAAMLYFGGAGVAAAYGHDVFRTWAKYRSAQ